MKKRDMNELRQEKTYGYKPPIKEEEPKNYTKIDIDTTKDLIISKLGKQYYDIIFQAVCDEMEKHEVFKQQTYFTPQGMNEFEDEWFEFYHEHHGDILHAVINNGIDHTN